MIKVIENSMDWLLNIRNLKRDYVYKYVENYLESEFNLELTIDSDNTQFDLDDSAVFGSVQDILDNSDDYKIVKVLSDKDLYFNKEYSSESCKYKHNLNLVGDFENYEYLLTVIVDDTLSDDELIDLYNENDDLLMELISDKKVIRNGNKSS